MKHPFVLLLVPLAVACGGKIEEASDGTSATPAATAVPTGTTTPVPPPPSPPSPGQPGPTPADPPPSKKVLTAQAFFGGLDHLFVFAADPVANSCVRVHLTNPGPGPKDGYPNVFSPKPWGVRDITRAPGADRCGPGRQPPAAETADDAKGTIAFVSSSSQVIPCSIDVHMSAVFAGKPAIETLDGDKIPVQGCQ